MMVPSLSTVIVNVENNLCSIILNRADKKNALNVQLVADLKAAFNYASVDSKILVVVLSGAGNCFCSGADLSHLEALQSNSYEDNIKDSKSLSELFLLIAQFPKPVIAKVEGPALAGGCGLASVCDFIIAEENSIFGYPEVRIGFIAAMVSVFLIKQIGERKARELLLTAKILSANEALNFGLINSVVKKESLDDSVESLVRSLQKNSPEALKVTKELFSSFRYLDNSKEIDRLAKLNADFRKTKDFSEGVSSFLEKRKPIWATN